jgi:hypothetical protein
MAWEKAKPQRLEAAKLRLEQLLAENPITMGMYVRRWGNHLILGRNEPFGSKGELEADDRLRVTARTASLYGISVRRHTGRWEQTPFAGSLEELVKVIWSYMQHLVAPHG